MNKRIKIRHLSTEAIYEAPSLGTGNKDMRKRWKTHIERMAKGIVSSQLAFGLSLAKLNCVDKSKLLTPCLFYPNAVLINTLVGV